MENQGIQVLSRAADILRALKADDGGLSLGRIARRVGLPRSTVQRIVNGLVAEKLVMPNAVSGGYRLGPEILSLAQAARQDVVGALRPAIQALSRDTGETVDVSVYRGDGMIFVDQVVGTQRLRTVSAIGETFPLTVTANGKAALTWLGDGDVARIAAKRTPQAGHGKVAARCEVRNRKDACKRLCARSGRAHGRDFGGGHCLQGRGAVYAVSIPAPSQRFRIEGQALVEKLLALRTEIASALPEAEFRGE